MCAVSMIMDHGREQPRQIWLQPWWPGQFEELLKKAKKYDEMTGQPDCELDEKRQALKKIADELGIEISFP